ncbi:cation transporter [Thermophagus sp. OGC60D27]|uniref:cation transporter n=1 Tax=Thermophagus sp. OGC60D27 TaxID=3458415 RepID=UPI0040377CFE
MKKFCYHIPGMDCPSEEQIIRMKLEGIKGLEELAFDLEGRKLHVYYHGDVAEITPLIESLKMGGRLMTEEEVEGAESSGRDLRLERKMLWAVLIINAVFFVGEMVAGWLSGSMGLVADSLDMLADALVYGLSLWAVGAMIRRKKRVAAVSGYLQLILAILGLSEVIRRFTGVEIFPDFRAMIIVSIFALIANAVSLYLLQKSKSKGEHVKASMICTSNDVIINAGIILSGALVYWFGSPLPDLIIGSFVFVLIVWGAVRIIKLSQ